MYYTSLLVTHYKGQWDEWFRVANVKFAISYRVRKHADLDTVLSNRRKPRSTHSPENVGKYST